jgi:S-DNA-T family DNA segregation ATPase FtsK/SpoIIIE
MELLLRVHRGEGAAVDVRVEIEPDVPVAQLAAALADAVGLDGQPAPRLTHVRRGEVLDPALEVGAARLVSGDDLLVGATQTVPPPPPVPARAVSLDVLAGPDSGHSAVLDRGRYVLGRGDDCELVVSDPTVSRRHVDIEVGLDWTVTITPLGGTENGVAVNDVPVEEPTAVVGDDVVTLGATRVAFREFIRAGDEAIDRLGQVEFHRTPYRPVKVHSRELEPLGPVPARPEPRRFQIFSVLAPLAAGLVLFAFTRQIQFLAIILISPLAMVGNWFEDRRSGRTRFKDQLAAFHDRIDRRKDEVGRALAAERVERVRSAPDLADLARRADLRTIDLWPRGRRADDFLTVRVGLADTTSQVTAPVAAGGDEELRAEAAEALAGQRDMPGVPVALPLAELGVLAVHGDPDQVDDVVASLVVQLACLHSPEDLVMAAALTTERSAAGWTKWLPHTRSVTSPMAGAHLATTQHGARRLLAELIEVAELRTAEDHRGDRRWPWVLVVLDGDLDPDPTLVSQLLERCPEAGISVVWACTSEARVPRQATAVVDCQLADEFGRATLWQTDPDVEPVPVELGRVHPEVADRVARRLAPVRDASVTTPTTAIPRTAPLLSVLGTPDPDPDWVLARWRTDRRYGLEAQIGLSAAGVFSLDLVADGPHALIGGTSGAGKSELLQSLVASLITRYPPSRLNFLFVDYKGGASSTVFRDVPHTVGYVTNLDALLSLRALTSLRAELDRRMRLLEGRAKDLEEMLARHPEDAPPSLVIVVDEFATLVKEVPEFVAGMVDIAQRGRSLGIHLVLATQRPSGSVNENILANTNLRLSLRMLDVAESNAVIGSPEAADIPVPLRGRAFARLGPRELIAFQSAFAGAPMDQDEAVEVVVAPFTPESAGPVGAPTSRPGVAGSTRTHLDAVLDAVLGAAERSALLAPRAPWCEVLPEHLVLDDVLADPRGDVPADRAGRLLTLGLVDDPEHQDQYPAVVDLEEGGGLLVFGSGGSGKTTLLRTAALTAASSARPEDLVIVGIDFASRALRSIAPLPHVAALATGDDLEAVTRVIALLSAELEQRRQVLAEARAETLTAYRDQGGTLPRILVLVDGYTNLAATLTGGSYTSGLDQWLETFNRVVVDGRQAGIHCVLTADRRNGVPAVLHSSIAHRLVLRQADQGGYTDLGIPTATAKDLDLAPGRGLWPSGHFVQVACVADEADGSAQADALAERAGKMGGRSPLKTSPLPTDVPLAALAPVDPPGVPLGVCDLTLATFAVDAEHSSVLVAGLPRSGRSTTAATLAAGLEALGHERWSVGPGSSPLAVGADPHRSGFGRTEAIAPVLDDLIAALDSRPTARPRVLVVDDLDSLDDASLTSRWERLAGHEGVRVVATIEVRNVSGFSMNPLLNEVRKARRSIYLQPDDPLELFQLTGVKAPMRPGTAMPPGRGVAFVDRRPTLVQVARP